MPPSTGRRIVFFGTFDERRHPRVTVLREGLAARGHRVQVVNVPLDVDTAARVQLVEQPWRMPLVALRLLAAWLRLVARSLPVHRPDVVVVGYLGHLDVHLARCRWPRAHLVLDHMVSLAETLADRGLRPSGPMARLAAGMDRAAARRADTVVVDTAQHAGLLPPTQRRKTVVVPVGAPGAWFAVTGGDPTPPTEPDRDRPLAVVFFGLYTPLQGTPTIAEAIVKLRGQPVSWTMVGSGQERATCEDIVGRTAPVRWIDWVDATELPGLVASHDVCLGIFGTGPKAQRVVPNKVFQGAAAGCAIVTSDTVAQREALGDAAVYVPAGSASALAEAISSLADDPVALEAGRRAARDLAAARFTPTSAVAPLATALATTSPVGRRRLQPPLPPNAALRWDIVRGQIDALAPARILELGTGQGAVAARLASVAEYVGVEPDQTSRTTARSRLPQGARLVADLEELPAGGSFDLVCAFEVLEHIEDDAGTLAQWAAHLRPGGHVLVSVPADPERYGPFDELVGHVRRYGVHDLADLFTAVGLEPVAIRHYGGPLGALLEAGRNAIGRRRLARGAAGADAAARTAASGRNLQPPDWAGPLVWAATGPFRVVQRRSTGRGTGLIGLARRPG